MKTITALLASLLLAMPVSAQTTQKLSANKTNEYGLLYTLPVTGVDVTIEVERTVKTPGDYFRYAKKYLAIDPITEKSQHWVIKSVTVNPVGVADPSQRYQVQFKAGSTPFMVIDDNNFPVAINTEQLYTPRTNVVLQPKLPSPQFSRLRRPQRP